jgi:hypothetical protein
MARVYVPLLLCLGLLASTVEASAGTLQERPAPAVVSGVYSITFHLSIFSTLPTGTILTCRAWITPNPARNPRNQPLASAPAQAVGRVVFAGSTAACTAEIPFAWTAEGAPGGVVLSYEIDAVSRSGVATRLVSGAGVGAALPCRSANLRLNVSL